MASEAPTPLPVRASDLERERAARALRHSSVDGRISLDTFSRRIEETYRARSREELGELVADLPRRSPLGLVARTVERASGAFAEIEAAWRRPRAPVLTLPAGESITIGRTPSCDCLISDPTVSRRHAELRRDDDGWTLTDLGSTNGTRVNGRLIADGAAVRPGDLVVFGAARFRLGRP
jgi:hypothetical protein